MNAILITNIIKDLQVIRTKNEKYYCIYFLKFRPKSLLWAYLKFTQKGKI